MNLLTKALLEDLLDTKKTVAIYGGGFKPPTKGHFNVAEKVLADFPEIDKLKIFVGSGVRDGITQDESLAIWNIYKNYLSDKVDVEPSIAPVKSVLGYAKENPDTKVYWILGAREGDEEDLKDIANRTRSIEKYPNLEVKVITSKGGVSGTKTRKAIADNNKEQFFHLIPDVKEKEEIWNIVNNSINEVGEANLKPYKWEEVDVEGYWVYTRFITDNETQYEVDIRSTVYYPEGQMESRPALEIEFSAKPKDYDSSSTHIVVNKGEMYRVMATIVDIIKKYAKKARAQAIIYSPDKKSGEEIFGNQRDKLYRAFISKAFPGTTFRQSGDFVTAILPNNAALTLHEGRYDSLTRNVVRDIMDDWKSQFDGSEGKLEYNEDYESGIIDFELYAVLTVKETKYGLYKVDGGADPLRKPAYLEIKFQVDPRDLPQKWEDIYMDLTDVVRHELEHMTQQGTNVIASKEMADDEVLRKLIKLKFLPKSDYYKLEQEVDAMLQGMYLKAKKSKTPFIEVINDYFDKARVSKKDRQDILDLWRQRAKALSLPLNEDKDPFGLNELARTFVKEVFEEDWNPKEAFLSLCVFMKDNGMNILPLPKIKVISDDKENASRLLGKTAYYNPADKSITLYTFGRHPKDVLRSFAHEMVHHEQNLNDTLGNISTTNTNEDGHLEELEKEAYLKGNIMLRNWEDSIKNV